MLPVYEKRDCLYVCSNLEEVLNDIGIEPQVIKQSKEETIKCLNHRFLEEDYETDYKKQVVEVQDIVGIDDYAAGISIFDYVRYFKQEDVHYDRFRSLFELLASQNGVEKFEKMMNASNAIDGIYLGYEELTGKYMVHTGRHRVALSKLVGIKTIVANVSVCRIDPSKMWLDVDLNRFL